MFKLVKWLFTTKEPSYMLGRWCHRSLPKCGDSVIDKKIDFAISDNSMGRYMKPVKRENYKVSEYIDYWRNV